MARTKKSDPNPAGDGQDGTGSQFSDVHADGGAGAVVADDNENRSSETAVLLQAEDEPVRYGGHVLTANGWVLEGAETSDDEQAEDDPAEDEQE